MFLNRSIPLIFGTPNPKVALFVYSSTFALMAIAIICYFVAAEWASLPYFGILSILIGLHGLIALVSTRGNLLILFRYYLVWILIFAAALMWAIYDGEVLVAPFGEKFQTATNTRILVLAGFFSLCGSLVGWHMAFAKFSELPFEWPVQNEHNRNLLKLAGAALAIFFSLMYLYNAGGFVSGQNTYYDQYSIIGFEFGVFNVFHLIGVSMLIVSGIERERINPRILSFCVFTLVIGVLTGSRADFLPQIFIILLLFHNKHLAEAIATEGNAASLKLGLISISYLTLGYFVASFVAVWRGGVDAGATFSALFDTGYEQLLNYDYGHAMLYFETGNMMLGGMYAAIVNVNDDITGFLFGTSYLDYFLRLPPAFLGIPRPDGLEWYVLIDWIEMSQGGIFEPAEAFWNFGIPGCFVVSFVLSYCFGRLLKAGLEYNSYYFLVWYLLFGFMSFRAIWYQNFSYFRQASIMIIIFFIAKAFAPWFISLKAKNGVIRDAKSF